MAERIQITPGPGLEAPMVQFAEARVAPSPVGVYAETIAGGLQTFARMMGRKEEIAEDDGRTILDDVSKSYRDTLMKLEESDQLTQANINQAQRQALTTLHSSLTGSKVPIKNFSPLRATLEAEFKQDSRFTVHESDTTIIERNENTGAVNVKFKDPEEQQAIALSKFQEDLSPARALLISTMAGPDQQKELSAIMKERLSFENFQTELKTKEARLNMFKADKETRKLAYEGDYNRLRTRTYETLNSDMTSTIKLVQQGGMTADQAAASFEQKYNRMMVDPDIMDSLQTLGRNQSEFAQSFMNMKADFTEAIKAFSPEEKLSVKALMAQKRVDLRKDQVLLNMPEPTFVKMTTAKQLAGVVMSDQLMKILGKGTSLATLNQLSSDNNRHVRMFSKVYERFDDPDLKGEEGMKLGNGAANFVAKALINANAGYESENMPSLVVENLMSAVRLLQTNPNYEKFVDPRIKNVISDQLQTLKATFGKDRKVSRLINKEAEKIQSIRDMQGMGGD